MRFTFVRHGQPEWFRDGAAVDNPGLTALGSTQADHVARRFRHDHADLLLVSPLVRARQTCAPVAEVLDLEPVVCDWLAEIASPPWGGAPLDQVQQVFETHRERPVEAHREGLDGGESFHDFHRRVTHGLQTLLDTDGNSRAHAEPALWKLDQPDRHVVIVAHGGTDASLIGYLLGIPPTPWEWERFVTYHASTSEVHPIRVSGHHAYSLTSLSDVSHLPPGLRTR